MKSCVNIGAKEDPDIPGEGAVEPHGNIGSGNIFRNICVGNLARCMNPGISPARADHLNGTFHH
jgi:hypothetical protein